MSADRKISRRGFAAGLAWLGLGGARAWAQGFAGLGGEAAGFARVVPGKRFVFPDDFGAHPEFRIEWWYVTANLRDASGVAYGAQWTLFRQAMAPGPQREGWANQQVWMGHAAVTSATTHQFAETFARGGVGQAGADVAPFEAWIDAWRMSAVPPLSNGTFAPLQLTATGTDFEYTLRLNAERPLVLQGDHGYSRKSERGQASYYYSQPYFTATGSIKIGGQSIAVSGPAWLDREWSSQPLAADQTGWDWFSLHLDGGDKVMLFRLRQKDGGHYFAGNWIGRDGQSIPLPSDAIAMTPTAFTDVAQRRVPTRWHVAVPSRGLAVDCTPLNARSWMGTSFPYWEGPIAFHGSHEGVGYLEMTGY
ncbi:MAG: iron ABC transporter permease [Rhizobiales bacterium]|nr:iron ABC transporter permease [Hyphomicrobiales bacterium]